MELHVPKCGGGEAGGDSGIPLGEEIRVGREDDEEEEEHVGMHETVESENVADLERSVNALSMEPAFYEGVVTSVGASFAILNHDCYVPRHFVNMYRLQVGQPLRVVAVPHASGRNKWRAKQVTPLYFAHSSPSHAHPSAIVSAPSASISISSSAGTPVVFSDMLTGGGINMHGVGGASMGGAPVGGAIGDGGDIFSCCFPSGNMRLMSPMGLPGIEGFGVPGGANGVAAQGAGADVGMRGKESGVCVEGASKSQVFVGEVTSAGNGFCIVNKDIFVPATLLQGKGIREKMLVRVDAIPRVSGRNKWRAIHLDRISAAGIVQEGDIQAITQQPDSYTEDNNQQDDLSHTAKLDVHGGTAGSTIMVLEGGDVGGNGGPNLDAETHDDDGDGGGDDDDDDDDEEGGKILDDHYRGNDGNEENFAPENDGHGDIKSNNKSNRGKNKSNNRHTGVPGQGMEENSEGDHNRAHPSLRPSAQQPLLTLADHQYFQHHAHSSSLTYLQPLPQQDSTNGGDHHGQQALFNASNSPTVSSANGHASSATRDSGLRHIVGMVTSQGREFCIVNHDVYVPGYLLSGIRRIMEGHTILRLTVCPLRAGRNKWRALEAFEVPMHESAAYGFIPPWDVGVPIPMGPHGILTGPHPQQPPLPNLGPHSMMVPPHSPSHAPISGPALPPSSSNHALPLSALGPAVSLMPQAAALMGSRMPPQPIHHHLPINTMHIAPPPHPHPGTLSMMSPLPPPGTAPLHEEQQFEVVGHVTSCGAGFCIVNHDVYVPSHLLGGSSVAEGTFMRLIVVARRTGRNNWRALTAAIQG